MKLKEINSDDIFLLEEGFNDLKALWNNVVRFNFLKKEWMFSIFKNMNVFEIEAPTAEAARKIALRLYQSIRNDHDWGQHFGYEPSSDVLDCFADLPPREMRRAWMTAFGNARLDSRDDILVQDLPISRANRSSIGFLA